MEKGKELAGNVQEKENIADLKKIQRIERNSRRNCIKFRAKDKSKKTETGELNDRNGKKMYRIEKHIQRKAIED